VNRMVGYYLSRALISAALGGILALAGSPWWMSVSIGLLALAFFVWAPRSGRYAVRPESGIAPLRRDERTQMINDRAARNAFVVSMLAIAAAAIYFGLIARANVPVIVLNGTFTLGVLTYFVSDAILRKS
jgi:hypothetical protein